MLGQLEGVSKSNPFDTEVKYSNNISRSFVAGIDRAIGITGYITSQIGVENLLRFSGLAPTEEQKLKCNIKKLMVCNIRPVLTT